MMNDAQAPAPGNSQPPATAVPADAAKAARQWLRQGRSVALATVVETWGSAPVRPGGQLAVAALEEFQGSVSGGCIEADVITAGLDVIASGVPQTLTFGISNETAWRAGLACGGRMRIFVERLAPGADEQFLDTLAAAARARRAMVVATALATGERRVLAADATSDPAIRDAINSSASRLIAQDGHETFLHVLTPPPRLVLIGATHIAQVLCSIAAASGYDVVILDPRDAFTSHARFAPESVVTAWPQDKFRQLANEPFAAVVTLTHVNAIDDEALAIALKLPCRYIGALGARKTHAQRVERLRAAGFSAAEVARIHAPVGLNIGAVTPGEIAVSIMAEVIAAFRTGDAASMPGPAPGQPARQPQ